MLENNYSDEEQALFNPAFTGFLLLSTMREFSEECDGNMHCALPFLLMPMTLNSSIASTLPNNKRSSLIAWISAHNGELADFPDLARSYVPLVLMSVAFLVDRSAVHFSEEGFLRLGSASIAKSPSIFSKSESMRSAVRTAKFLGRWFAHAPPIETIFTQLGVRP